MATGENYQLLEDALSRKLGRKIRVEARFFEYRRLFQVIEAPAGR